MAWIGPVVQGVTGLAQTIAASAAAKNLPEAQKYEATPQMKKAEAMAERRAEQGMSQSERALFEQGMARRTNAAERSMRNLGLSGGGISGLFNIDAQNQFSAQSETERRKGEAMYAGIAGQMQAIQDRETSSFNQMLQQQRTALGGAAASGMKNITGAFGMAAQAANTNKLAEAYANSGDTINIGTGTTGATTTTPGIDLSVINTATAPGVGLPGTLEGSGAPFLPAAEQPAPSVFSSSVNANPITGQAPFGNISSPMSFAPAAPTTTSTNLPLYGNQGLPLENQGVDASFAGAPLNNFGGSPFQFIF